MALNDYLQKLQRFLREQNQVFSNPEDLVSHINTARREIAQRAQAIRVLTPISGAITGWSVTNGGSGYSNNPTLTITSPDLPSGRLPNPNGAQATALPLVQGGSIVAIDSQYGGAGYFQPTMTITDATGTGATATPQISWVNQLNQGQEVYPLSGIDLSAFPGCDSVYFVRSISILYSNYRYTLPMYAFSEYQAQVRMYPFQYTWVPSVSSQFGQGVDADFYVYPLPSQSYPCEFDCLVLPSDLTDDLSFDALPMPWRDAVPFYAAHLAMIDLQNFNAAAAFLALYEKQALAYSNYARIGRRVNPYGRY